MNEPGSCTSERRFVQWFVHLLVIFVCVGQSTPAVNESHYLPKAKHAWDRSFVPGDLFLDSHDAHFVATAMAGLLAWVAPLWAVAWIGRFISWSLFAWAWTDLCRAVRIPSILSPLALAGWYFAIAYGHWAGEWAIGGFEAKAIAYPFVLKGVTACINNRWRSVWLWMGAAVAWHPVAGGWAGISVGLIWLLTLVRRQGAIRTQLKAQLPWIAIGGLIALVGLLPALSGLGGSDRLGKVVASQVQVYYRLAHHMCPRTFELERHGAAILSLLALFVATLAWRLSSRSHSASVDQLASSEGIRKLLLIAWISVTFSVCGLLLDLALATYQPNLASKLLRFYWFRWSDVAVPLAWTLTFWHYAGSHPVWTSSSASKHPLGKTSLGAPISLARRIALGLGTALVLLCAYRNFQSNWQNTVPPADELVVQSTGPHFVETDRYVDWLAVCAWIRDNTPDDSLWLTPKYQQTFKWHAQRAEVVCWKDVPQDNASILEWYFRVQTCEPPRTPSGKLAEWSTAALRQLHKEYGFGWILVDRTVQQTPPNLEIAYPINIENRSFAIFRIDSR